jgi:hypothetical protein
MLPHDVADVPLLTPSAATTCCTAEYEESVEQFIRRNLGDEVFERLIEPFCSGVYAGNPSKLSMKAAFQRVRAGAEHGWCCCSHQHHAALQGRCCCCAAAVE